MQNEIKEGDIVRLNSGSQDLTVLKVSANLIECAYWNQEVGKIVYTGNHPMYLFNKVN